MTMSKEELAALGIQGPEDLAEQQEFIRGWNELIYSGAADHKGTQAQFMASVLVGGRTRG